MARGDASRFWSSNSKELQKETCRKAGIRSGEVRRRKSCFRECVKHYVGAKSEEDPKLSNLEAMVKAMIKKVLEDRDVRAFDSLRDTAGEKPSTMLDLSGSLSQEVKVDLSTLPPEQVDRIVDKAFGLGANE